MALRLIEAHVPETAVAIAEQVLRDVGGAEVWSQPGGAYGSVVKAILGAERTGTALDELHAAISPGYSLRVLVTSLDAVLPRPAAGGPVERRGDRPDAEAVSREEVYAAISGAAAPKRTYLVLIVLSTTVAAIGLTNDNTAAVIGAMVVAPLLGPNLALSLGLTLGDRPLIVRSFLSSSLGLAVALLTAVLLSQLIDVDPQVSEIESRTRVKLSDMVLAFAAGCAGTLGYTTGAPTGVVGVMVAVALLPPAVASGLLAGAGHWREAFGALLLALANVAALNLAAMATLTLSGIRPRHWWKEEQARRSARLGLLVFSILTVVLVGIVLVSQGFFA